MQVPMSAASLHSRDAFVLLTPQKSFLWSGYYSAKFTREAALAFAEILNRYTLAPYVFADVALRGSGNSRGEPVEEDEELETDEFWAAIGDKKDYCGANPIQSNRIESNPLHPSINFVFMHLDDASEVG